MECKTIQEFLLTDYIDNEASMEVRERVVRHCSACAVCRAYKERLESAQRALFLNTRPLLPPVGLWQGIAAALSVSAPGSGLPGRIRAFVSGLLATPLRIAATGLVAAAVLVGVVMIGREAPANTALNEYLYEQASFAVAPAEAAETLIVADDNSFGSVIEEYLL